MKFKAKKWEDVKAQGNFHAQWDKAGKILKHVHHIPP